jgi:hypothetical protein
MLRIVTAWFRGRRRLGRSRRLIVDLMRYQRSLPTVAQDRPIDVRPVAELRERVGPHIPWPLLFIKAFALVARRHPRLRQTVLRWPWLHVYEHPTSVATLALIRRHREEDWLFFGVFRRPENKSLGHLRRLLDYYKRARIQRVFYELYRLTFWPEWIRRFLWWTLWIDAPHQRIIRLGTFGLTTVSSQGVTIQQPMSPVSYILTYGPIIDGFCPMTIVYDHRLADGAFVAQVMGEIEQELHGAIRQELLAIVARQRAAAERPRPRQPTEFVPSCSPDDVSPAPPHALGEPVGDAAR